MANPQTRLLVVDDDPGVLLTCQRWLERAGFETTAVTSASQALAILERTPFDLLLVDIRMPGMDGFQLMALARHHQPDLAVVVMTGFGSVETAIETLQRGADGLVLKPFQGADLVHSVQNALEESERRRDAFRLQTLRPVFTGSEMLFRETDPDLLPELVVDMLGKYLQCESACLAEPRVPSKEVLARESLTHGEGEVNEPCWVHCSRSETSGDLSALQEVLYKYLESYSQPMWVNREGPLAGSVPAGQIAELRELLGTTPFGSLLAVRLEALRPHNGSAGQSRLFLAARREREPNFQEADAELFAILARQAAAALDNASLTAELRTTIQSLERSQSALVQAEKMSAAGRLTASIAHEINNPLQSVSSCLDLAGREELNAKERRHYMDLAQSELDRLMATVQRMLNLYRPIALDRQLLEINELVKRVAALLGPQLERGLVQLHMNLERSLPKVIGVGDQIQQVLINLMLNAMEAMPGGGELWVSTERIPGVRLMNRQRGSMGNRDWVSIKIADSGPGIPDEIIPMLFEPFSSTKPNGTGLGLAVSYGIITAHGGTLTLEPQSAEDTAASKSTGSRETKGGNGRKSRGACFTINLPGGEEK